MSDHRGCCILHHVIGPSEAQKLAEAERSARAGRERIEAMVVRWVREGRLPFPPAAAGDTRLAPDEGAMRPTAGGS